LTQASAMALVSALTTSSPPTLLLVSVSVNKSLRCTLLISLSRSDSASGPVAWVEGEPR